MSRKPDRTFFSDRELAVMDYAAHWHRHQKRKYTGEPYVNHLAAVAKTVKNYTENSLMVVAAFCHDLYEDTSCKESELLLALSDAGFNPKEIKRVNKMVWELTDEFVKDKYPDLNRGNRKQREAERLWNISAGAQNVKYADLIDNAIDLAENDKSFVKIYLREMNQILKNMTKGNKELYNLALETAKELTDPAS